MCILCDEVGNTTDELGKKKKRMRKEQSGEEEERVEKKKIKAPGEMPRGQISYTPPKKTVSST